MGAIRGGRRVGSSGRAPQDSYVMQYGPAGTYIQIIEVCTHKFNQTSELKYRHPSSVLAGLFSQFELF